MEPCGSRHGLGSGAGAPGTEVVQAATEFDAAWIPVATGRIAHNWLAHFGLA